MSHSKVQIDHSLGVGRNNFSHIQFYPIAQGHNLGVKERQKVYFPLKNPRIGQWMPDLVNQ